MVTHLLALLLATHPLHTTMTELTVDPAAKTVRAVTRLFVDDLRRASGNRTSADQYVMGQLSFVDGSRGTVPLQSCGVRRVGELLFVCVEGVFSGGVGELRLSNRLLCEAFEDQVNVVQVSSAGVRRSVLYVKGDREKGVITR